MRKVQNGRVEASVLFCEYGTDPVSVADIGAGNNTNDSDYRWNENSNVSGSHVTNENDQSQNESMDKSYAADTITDRDTEEYGDNDHATSATQNNYNEDSGNQYNEQPRDFSEREFSPQHQQPTSQVSQEGSKAQAEAAPHLCIPMPANLPGTPTTAEAARNAVASIELPESEKSSAPPNSHSVNLPNTMVHPEGCHIPLLVPVPNYGAMELVYRIFPKDAEMETVRWYLEKLPRRKPDFRGGGNLRDDGLLKPENICTETQSVLDVLMDGNKDEVVLKWGNPSYPIIREDLVCLKTGRMVNASIVDCYFELLCRRNSERSSALTVTSIRTYIIPMICNQEFTDWSRLTNSFASKNLFHHDIILVPCYFKKHYALICVDVKNRVLKKYCSLQNNLGPYTRKLAEFLRNYARQVCKTSKERESFMEWTEAVVQEIPLQYGSLDCALFICKYAEHICVPTPTAGTFREPMEFSQNDMEDVRNQVLHQIFHFCTNWSDNFTENYSCVPDKLNSAIRSNDAHGCNGELADLFAAWSSYTTVKGYRRRFSSADVYVVENKHRMKDFANSLDFLNKMRSEFQKWKPTQQSTYTSAGTNKYLKQLEVRF